MKKLIKIHNKFFTYLLRFLSIAGAVVIFFNVTLAMIPGSLGWMFSDFTASYISATVIILIILSRFRTAVFQMEYEIISMRDLPLFKEIPLNAHYNGSAEFPRRMVLSYKFEKKFLAKNLVVKTLSNSNEEKIKKLEVTFLTPSQQKEIAKILDAVVEKNKKRREGEKSS